MQPIRASEPNALLTTLPDPTWVECPRCSRPARITRKPHRYRIRAEAIVTCGHCAFRHEDAEVYRAMHSRKVYPARWRGKICAKCGGDKFDPSSGGIKRHKSEVSFRSRCRGCGHLNTIAARGGFEPIRDGHDHWFGLPVVLRIRHGSRYVWAYNVEHIAMLEGWLEAELRERSLHPYYATMAARLPKWMKAAHARRPVLRALGKLRSIAEREGLS